MCDTGDLHDPQLFAITDLQIEELELE